MYKITYEIYFLLIKHFQDAGGNLFSSLPVFWITIITNEYSISHHFLQSSFNQFALLCQVQSTGSFLTWGLDRTPLASSSVLELLAGDSVLLDASTFPFRAISAVSPPPGGGRPLGPPSTRLTGLSALLMWGMLNSGGGGWLCPGVMLGMSCNNNTEWNELSCSPIKRSESNYRYLPASSQMVLNCPSHPLSQEFKMKLIWLPSYSSRCDKKVICKKISGCADDISVIPLNANKKYTSNQFIKASASHFRIWIRIHFDAWIQIRFYFAFWIRIQLTKLW